MPAGVFCIGLAKGTYQGEIERAVQAQKGGPAANAAYVFFSSTFARSLIRRSNRFFSVSVGTSVG